MDPITLYAYAALAIFLAGMVKGAVGLGLPTTALGILTLFIDPRSAIALVLVPMFVANVWQMLRAGQIRRTIRRYAPFVLCLVLWASGVFALTSDAPERLLLAGLGGLMLAYVALSVSQWAPDIPDHADRAAQISAGSLSGVLGGLIGIWAPPMALYLAARRATKDEFVRASGLILGVGSLPLIAGYIREGFLTPAFLQASVLMLVPTFAGFALGERLRGRLSEAGFRRALMVFFALAGLNLLRRAVF